jgi:hypothetical protein
MDTSLTSKLQLKPGLKLAVLNAPSGYYDQLKAALSENTLTSRTGKADAVLLFAASVAELNKYAAAAIGCVRTDGLVWMAYPKGTSKIETDLNRDHGWEVVVRAGLEGVRLVAIDDTWSAMRFRPTANKRK